MSSDERRDALLAEYKEVAADFRTLTDIRFKLLAFLPIASSAAAALITARDATDAITLILAAFGLTATLGIVTYNARNDQLYDGLVWRAAAIERSLGIPDGRFATRPAGWLSFGPWKIDHRIGVAIIYCASIALWMALGFSAVARMLTTSGYIRAGAVALALATTLGAPWWP